MHETKNQIKPNALSIQIEVDKVENGYIITDDENRKQYVTISAQDIQTVLMTIIKKNLKEAFDK